MESGALGQKDRRAQTKMCDELYGELDAISRRLEPLMTKLAKACLIKKPDDLDKFCYDFFAARIGASPRQIPKTSAVAQGKAEEPRFDDGALDDDEEASEAEADYTAAIMRAKSRRNIVRKTNYESSDDDDEQEGSPVSQGPGEKPTGALTTGILSTAAGDGKSVVCEDDSDEDDVIDEEELANYRALCRVKSMKPERCDIAKDLTIDATEKSKENSDRITKLTEEAKDDPRMKTLFDTWDADGGGTVDLVELVVAMHKFNRVMEDGSGLKRASEALLHNNDDESQELDIAEFARFIVTFCDEAYGKTFDQMAAHMLAVASSSSERAALAVASGHQDIEQIIKNDEEEIEVLKETIRGVEASVVENITKIKTSRKVMFQ